MTGRHLRFAASMLLATGSVSIARQPAATGLDSLPESRVRSELAQRGLDSLLDRSFEIDSVPQSERVSTRAVLAMRELRDPRSRLSARQREELVGRIVRGMESAVREQRDPQLLISTAEELIRAAVFREINTLEYWGDSTVAMGRLRPVAQLVSQMLSRAQELARAQADEVANRLTSPTDTAGLERFQQLDQLAVKAEYTRRMNDYAVVLSTDPADAARRQLADETLNYLKQFDDPESTVQPVVRLQSGKLALAKGDFDGAVRLLDSLWKSGPAGTVPVTPALTTAQRFEARYFAAVAALRAGRAEESATRVRDLQAFIESDLANSGDAVGSRRGAEAAVMMLQYRQHVAEKNDDKARETLIALVRAQPELEGTVLEQLSGRLPADPDVRQLDLLLLRALFRRGEMELRRPEGQPVDEQVLGAAIDAGRELVARYRGASAAARPVDPGIVEAAAIRLPLLLDRAGRRAQAAAALLDFIETFGPAHRDSPAALDEAAYLIGKLRTETPDDTEAARVYERFLAIAVAEPFSRTDLAYDWARRLQQTGRYARAIEYFAKVPASDPRAALARFFKMVALKQTLDDTQVKLPAAEREARVREVLTLADQVTAEAKARLGKQGNDDRNDKLILVRTALVGADVALREQKDARRALKLLEGFETSVAGLTGERELTAQAMNVRVLAMMDLGDNEQATRVLVSLLEKTGGAEGAEIVFKLLTRLNDDFDRARREGNAPAVTSLARARAGLSGFLVTWAEKHPDARVRDLAPRYRLFDADTRRLAATLEPDAARREQGLRAALGQYESLRDPAKPDAVVDLGIALVAYDLGDMDRARSLLAQLLDQRRLGRPTLEEDRGGETVVLPNDRYWEATYKLMRSTLVLVEQGKAEASVRTAVADGLKALFARWGRTLGGPKWASEFEKLRTEIAPDFAVPDLDLAPPSPVGAVAPR